MGWDGLDHHLPSVQHGGGGTASFADGHVDFHEWRDPDTTKTARDKWIPNHFTIQVPRNQDLALVEGARFVAEGHAAGLSAFAGAAPLVSLWQGLGLVHADCRCFARS